MKKIVYILTRFPMKSETFVYNEILGLKRKQYNITSVFALLNEHQEIEANLERLNISYPPPGIKLIGIFFRQCFSHPLDVFKIIVYAFKIHRGEYFSLKEGETSFIKTLFIMPRILWINKSLGESEVHLHGFFAVMATTVVMVLAHIRNCSYSFTGRGSDILRYGPKNLDLRINSAAFFYTPSNYNKNYILEKYPGLDPAKIHVIPSGVDVTNFKPSATRLASNGKIIFLTTARFSPEKGIDIFLRAFSKFIQEQHNVEYHLIGDGPVRNELELITADENIRDNVIFWGAKSPSFIARALQKCHLFVLTSFSEGFPNVLMEAWASGLPILATNITAIPEIVLHEDNGLLVRPGDIDDIYRSLCRLAENNWTLLNRLSENARLKDLHKYNREKSLHKVGELMDLVSEHRTVSEN